MPKKKKQNRFNKNKFNEKMLSIMNDPSFVVNIARNRHDGVKTKEINPTKEFRNWCKKLLEKCGMDKKEASAIMAKDFQFDTAAGLYDFFISVMYEYMNEGNRIDFIPREDFKGTLSLVDVPEKEVIRKHYNPQDRSFLGEFKEKKKKHKELRVKSSCPKYLKDISKFM